MNFQTVSTAEKLPTSDGLTGGYLADGKTPGPLLARALDYINAQVGAMVNAIKRRHLPPDRQTVPGLANKRPKAPASWTSPFGGTAPTGRESRVRTTRSLGAILR
jgi:hypothetical protein